jgi:hypothetical protein
VEVEDLIRRAASLLDYGLDEAEVRDILLATDPGLTEEQLFLAVRAARVLRS